MAPLNLDDFAQRIQSAFASVDEDGKCEFSCLLDIAALARSADQQVDQRDWKGLARIVQNTVLKHSGVHFVYHDVRSSPKKFAHCSRYLCASRASSRIAEQNRRRNNAKILKYECRGTLNCSILHGHEAMLVSVIHIDHDVVGIAQVKPLQAPSDWDQMLQQTPLIGRERGTISPSVSAEEDFVEEGPALKRQRIEDGNLFSTSQPEETIYPQAYLASPIPRAPIQQMPTEEVMMMRYSPAHQTVALPPIMPFQAPMSALPHHLVRAPIPTPYATSHVSPAPPLLERPLSSMSGFAAEADHNPQQDAENVLGEVADVIRSGRALQPHLDDFFASARRLIDAARMAEEADRQSMARHLNEAEAVSRMSEPPPSSVLLQQTPFVEQNALHLGDLNLGLTMDSWRRINGLL